MQRQTFCTLEGGQAAQCPSVILETCTKGHSLSLGAVQPHGWVHMGTERGCMDLSFLQTCKSLPGPALRPPTTECTLILLGGPQVYFCSLLVSSVDFPKDTQNWRAYF